MKMNTSDISLDTGKNETVELKLKGYISEPGNKF